MKFSRLSRRRTTATRQRRSLLRRIGIGWRLWLFVALPASILVAIIGLLVWSDVVTVNQLRNFESTTTSVGELVEAQSTIQHERHALTDPDEISGLSNRALADELLGPRMIEQLRLLNPSLNIGDELIAARGLAQSDVNDSHARYTTVIDSISDGIRLLLDESPDGEIDRRSDALQALLSARESLLLEDLEVQAGSQDPITVGRLHTTATEALSRYVNDAGVETLESLEALTVTEAWRETTIMRANLLESTSNFVHMAAWDEAAEPRLTGLDDLVATETSNLVSTTRRLTNDGIDRMVFLSVLVASVLIIFSLATLAIRRSIVVPLGKIGDAAKRLHRGELAVVEDNASDEIGEVAHAFSSLYDTMRALWADIDEVARSVGDGEFDVRIQTNELEGDWRRLAEIMNTALQTGQEHSMSVNDELARREVLTNISSAALAAENAGQLTAAVLHHLPEALPGSHAHLHVHPSGPPLFALGTPLEPTISALELPTGMEKAQIVEVGDQTGIAALVDFGAGPPAVLVLRFGDTAPTDTGPVLGLIETAAGVLAQAHRRQAAEWSATHNLEHDSLTGMFNSSGLQRWWGGRDDSVADSGQFVVVGVQPLRLDELDSTSGRGARNTVLKIAASRLRRALNEYETSARLGDPEFVVIVPEADADELVERIIEAFAHPLSIDDELVLLELTIGIADIDAPLEQAIANASTAIRESEGRNTSVVHFAEEQRERAVRSSELRGWLETAVENNDFEVHYQPVVDAVSTNIGGYECLIRGSRNGVPVSPGEFIPLAEESTLIFQIGEFVLREACAALPFLPGDSPYVAINLSPVELRSPRRIDSIDRILTDTKVDRSRIVLEVTEGAATTDQDVEVLHRLRKLGVRIAIDDFGTGHSNLSYLTSLPAQILKLDRSLVTPIVDDKAALAVVSGAISMAHEIGMKVVGEGVETNDELNALRRVRCDMVQGWLTGRPKKLADLVDITTGTSTTHITQPVSR